MRKLKHKSGFTLMEMLVSITVLVLLVMGIGTSMDSGLQVYKTSMFQSNSGTLSGIINTSLGDILRYAEDIKPLEQAVDNIEFVFTNPEFGVVDAYFSIDDAENAKGVLQLKQVNKETIVDLVNRGAYPDLEVTNFKITYVAPGSEAVKNDGTTTTLRGGYFKVYYEIHSTLNNQDIRKVETIVRLLNEV